MINQNLVLDNLKSSINNIFALSQENWEILSTCLCVIKLRKGEFLLKTGDFCNSVYYIDKGYCRLFQVEDGQEVNLNFHFENEFVTNIKSFVNKIRSEYSMVACEQMIVVKIDKTKLMEGALKNTQEFEIFGRKILEAIIMKQDDHLKLFKLYNAQQRFEYIEKNRPEIIRRVALTQIASYLGVTRETLTRIRKRKLSQI
jgi:CRP-like cAMP-binding protein